jgi:hypothetical protein
MNEFVNYGKRSVDLPDGCKNLMDVLAPAPSSNYALTDESKEVPLAFPAKGSTPSILTNRIPRQGLAKLAIHVEWFWPAECKRMVSINIPGGLIGIMLLHEQGIPKATFVLNGDATARESKIRKIFSDAKIPPCMDDITGSPPAVKRVLKYSLNGTAVEAIQLLRIVLQDAFDVSEESSLAFICMG